MEPQRAVLVVLIMICFIQLQTFAGNLEHQRLLMQRRFYEDVWQEGYEGELCAPITCYQQSLCPEDGSGELLPDANVCAINSVSNLGESLCILEALYRCWSYN